MIIIKNTKNFAGVSIIGDYNDFDNLVDAFHSITIDEYTEKHQSYVDMSIRVLGLCYDVRHAMQGDREIELVENGMDEDKMKFHSIITPKNNVYFKCNCLYPEIFFVMLALNELITLRIRELAKSKYYISSAFDKKVIWDDKIIVIRCFQAEIVKCVKEILTDASFIRWLNIMNSDFINIYKIAGQYVDLLNIKYIKMPKEKRLKSLSSIARRIAQYGTDREHEEIKEVVNQAAKQNGCMEGNIRLKDIEYPDDVLW
jgi:hypothetical protein